MTSASPAASWAARGNAPPVGSVAPVVLVLGSIAALGASHGGYFPSSWGWSALVFSWSGTFALLVKRSIAVSRAEVVYVGALTAVLGWTAASLLWTSTATQTVYETERTLSYVTFAAALVLVTRRVDVPVVLGATLAAVTALAAYGLLTRILPGRLTTFDSIAVYRLDSPIGYWNAVGAISAFGTILAAGFAARARASVVRALAASATVVLLPTLYFTFGRGGWLALFAGLAAAVALDPRRLQLVTTLAVVAPWPALALWRAYESKGLTTDYSPLSTAATDGRRLAWTLLGLAVCAFATTFLFAHASSRVQVHPSVRRVFAAVLAVGAAGAIGATIAAYGGPAGITRHALDSIRQSTPNVRGDQTKRLFSLSTNGRLTLWSSALDDARAILWSARGPGRSKSGGFETGLSRPLSATPTACSWSSSRNWVRSGSCCW